MQRGDLSNVPAPLAHLDYRIVYAAPQTGWRRMLWRLFDKVGFAGGLCRLLILKRHADNWIVRRTGIFQFDLVVVGEGQAVCKAVAMAAERDSLWIVNIAGFDSWSAYGEFGRAVRNLVELVVPVDTEMPLLMGVTVRTYGGWGHVIGRL